MPAVYDAIDGTSRIRHAILPQRLKMFMRVQMLSSVIDFTARMTGGSRNVSSRYWSVDAFLNFHDSLCTRDETRG